MDKKYLLTLVVFAVAGLVFGGMASARFGKGAFKEKVFTQLDIPEGATPKEAKALIQASMLEDLGLSENASMCEIREAQMEKKVMDLGLTPESSIAELHEALKTKKLEKLGLSPDATCEQIQDSMQEKNAGNNGFHKGAVGFRGHGTKNTGLGENPGLQRLRGRLCSQGA